MIVRNRYYTDSGMEYAFGRLRAEFEKRGVACELVSPYLTLEEGGRAAVNVPDSDFAIYWNKDAELCAALETSRRCFNSARAVAVCDDKLKTYIALAGLARIPKTLAAPLMYAASDDFDRDFLDRVEELGFPLIAKERVGSRGEQVHLVKSRDGLNALYSRLKRTPHLYEAYIAGGDRDLRVYVIGGRALGAVSRQGRGFKSNLYAGAGVRLASPDASVLRLAERIAVRLSLDYCAVDFIGEADPVLVEVNSNAYFTGAEQCGLDVAGRYAQYVTEVLYAGR